MTTEQPAAVARKFHTLYDQGDLAGMEQLVSKNCIVHQPGVPDALDFAAFRQIGVTFLSAFKNSRHVFEEQIAEGDKVMLRGTWSATQTGDFQGIPASGKSFKIDILIIDRVVEGKIVEHRAMMDTLGFMQQLGVIPAAQQG